ncbi:uncharacterized protein C8Q71DRAFT_726630 [Rhodofomes roseus]|uniref:Uncharacterized protein n=1 Tax=Rhodofomes roseus TaxID=34475 RepID=A0ABQ8K4V0_9APHY|nr:uncharacterized protein C8Q71DRAFT_726630 [Rhodofomes roseus]KAH9831738.1 hypothetical protein C8Q71DRAFT_726630 [Rhodofomes roseus]
MANIARYPLVEAKSGIDQHAWFIKRLVSVCKETSPANNGKVATAVAMEFEAKFPINQLGHISKANGEDTVETEEQRADQCKNHLKQIKRWFTNHRNFIDEQVAGAPQLLEIPKLRQDGVTDSKEVNKISQSAYSAAINDMKANDPERLMQYQEQVREATAALQAAQKARGKEPAEPEEEDEDKHKHKHEMVEDEDDDRVEGKSRWKGKEWERDMDNEEHAREAARVEE